MTPTTNHGNRHFLVVVAEESKAVGYRRAALSAPLQETTTFENEAARLKTTLHRQSNEKVRLNKASARKAARRLLPLLVLLLVTFVLGASFTWLVTPAAESGAAVTTVAPPTDSACSSRASAESGPAAARSASRDSRAVMSC